MKKILLFIVFLLSVNMLSAQTQKILEPIDHYNYGLAKAALDEGDYDKAYDYLRKELKLYPTNGYAYYWGGVILAYHIHDVEAAYNAVEMAAGYIPKKDKAYLSYVYRFWGDLFSADDKDKSAMRAYEQAIKFTPKDYRNYLRRADLLYKNQLYKAAAYDYAKAGDLAPVEAEPYMGIAKCMNMLGEKQKTLEVLKEGIRVNPEYSAFYSLRAVINFMDDNYEQSIDDVVKALKIDGDDLAYYMLSSLAQKNYSRLIAKLTLEQNADKTNGAWPYYQGVVHNAAKQYNKALAAFYKVYELQPDFALETLAQTWKKLGDFSTALKYINEAIAVDSSARNLSERAQIEDALGMYELALQDYDDIIAQNPKSSSAYVSRAWLKKCYGDLDGALDDYDMTIVLDPEPFYYMQRGNVYREKGMMNKARIDFEKVIELDTIATNYNGAEWAYFYLGKIEDAKKKMDSIMKDNDEHYYDAACLYSLINEQDKALDYFKQALENGERQFYHFERDHDLDNIRNLPKYKELIDEYKAKMNSEIEQLRKQYNITVEEESGIIEKTQEIGFTRRGGVCEVPCTINDLPLYFIFDTGASDVTISMVEATFMLKNKYLTSSDIIGRRNYMTANGDISEGTVINLRSVKFGDAVLNNVKASVVKSQTAPLLLGQSVLERLGKIEIDNTKKVLRVTYKEKK